MLFTISPIIDGIETLARGLWQAGNEKSGQFSLKNSKSTSQDFTILVPTYNSLKTIEQILENLEPYKGKVLVVDDASTDETPEAVRARGFSIVNNPTNGKKIGAIKLGLEEITSEYTIVMDSDTRLAEGDPARLVGLMYDKKMEAGAVRVLPEHRTHNWNIWKNILHGLQYIEYAKAMRIGRGSMNGSNPAVLCVSGAFGIFKTDLLRAVTAEQVKDGVHWEGEDLERTLRIIEKGGKVMYIDDFVVRTEVPEGLLGLTNQRIKWQHGYLRNHWLFKFSFVKRTDKLGLTLLYNWAVNIGLHPLKLYFAPALVERSISSLEYDAVFYGSYLAIEALASLRSLSRSEWKRYGMYLPAMPIYGLYQIAVPTTVGFGKAILEELKEVVSHRRANKQPQN